ncbi:hypothetical protein [Lactococcus allomyrinae]|uniref:Uncharacterized protein n=1 Tax=Lactococcus allomyrinae TaxID=2419773 RepID=A0A387BRQ4_9LACT|nr:hypothetical protein [Lactococcus allomyrinae]AYG01151.1 hypothetical protein D7I46_08610 [Lactococcus allomyrinae]
MKKIFKITSIPLAVLTIVTLAAPQTVFADATVPKISSFMQNNSVQVGLGWATIGIALLFLGAIFVGLFKVVPVATSFWKRRNGMDEGAENTKNFAIGWAMLIVVPIVITAVVGMTFGAPIVDAVKAAIQSIFS